MMKIQIYSPLVCCLLWKSILLAMENNFRLALEKQRESFRFASFMLQTNNSREIQPFERDRQMG